VIKLTSCLPTVGGSLRVLRLLPPLKLVAIIQNRATLNYFGLQGENPTEEEGNTAKGMS